MSQSIEDVYKKIRRALKENFPAKLDQIISSAGFDSERSFLSLNKESISDIEQYINENRQILTGTPYENSNQSINFKFKPGHKIFLLGIPKALEIYNKKKKEQKSSQTQKIQQNQNSESVNFDTENHTIEANNIEQELKKKLIDKVISFANKCSVTLVIDTNNIIELQVDNTKIKCQIICPICNKQLKCEHSTYWMISNFEKHLRRHFMNFTTQSVERDNPISYTENQADLDAAPNE